MNLVLRNDFVKKPILAIIYYFKEGPQPGGPSKIKKLL